MFGYGKEMALGIIGAFLQMGLNIDKIDWETETLYITIPERSYDYEFSAKNGGAVVSPEALARRIKETSNEMGIFKNGKVKYRTKDIYWTKEMGEENYKNNIDDYYRIISRL